jgi:hypothetical protein
VVAVVMVVMVVVVVEVVVVVVVVVVRYNLASLQLHLLQAPEVCLLQREQQCLLYRFVLHALRSRLQHWQHVEFISELLWTSHRARPPTTNARRGCE